LGSGRLAFRVGLVVRDLLRAFRVGLVVRGLLRAFLRVDPVVPEHWDAWEEPFWERQVSPELFQYRLAC